MYKNALIAILFFLLGSMSLRCLLEIQENDRQAKQIVTLEANWASAQATAEAYFDAYVKLLIKTNPEP